MRSRCSFLVAPVTAALLLLAAPSALAGTIVIDFDLSDSTLTMLDGILDIPSDGTITGATAQIRVPGSAITGPISGPGQLRNLVLTATINGTVGGAVLLTGGFTGSQVGGGFGTLTGGLANLIFGPLALNLNGIINCIGGACPILGTFPIAATNQPFVLSSGSLGLGGLGTLGLGTLNGVLSMNLAGNAVVLTVEGQEVSRTFIVAPEPNTAALLGLGILGVLGLGANRIRPR